MRLRDIYGVVYTHLIIFLYYNNNLKPLVQKIVSKHIFLKVDVQYLQIREFNVCMVHS